MSAHQQMRRARRVSPGVSLLTCAMMAMTGVGLSVSASQAQPAQADAHGKADLDNVLGSFNKAAYSPQDTAAYRKFIVKFAQDSEEFRNANERAEILSEAGDKVQVQVREARTMGIGAQLIEVSDDLAGERAHAFMDEVARNKEVAWIQPSYRQEVAEFIRPGVDRSTLTRTVDQAQPKAGNPNDSEFNKQWYLQGGKTGINITQAWDGPLGEGVTIAVIDTGVTNHPDLNPQSLKGYDFIKDAKVARDNDGRDGNPNDEGDGTDDIMKSTWHGSHVSSIAAGATNNNTGIAGVAPKAKLLYGRAFGIGGGDDADTNDGAVWAAGGVVPGVPPTTVRAKVINVSAGSRTKCTPADLAMVKKVNELGAVMVTAAGNGDSNGKGIDASTFSPGSCEGTINVAALNMEGTLTDFSNFGSRITLAAPGGQYDLTPGSKDREKGMIYAACNTGITTPKSATYGFKEGTSQAAPIVSGVVALMLSKSPNMTPQQISDHLKKTARPVPGGCAKGCGAGLVDPGRAVQNLPQGPAPAPSTPAPTGNPGPTSNPTPSQPPVPTGAPTSTWPPRPTSTRPPRPTGWPTGWPGRP